MRARTLAVLSAVILLGAASAALCVSCSVTKPPSLSVPSAPGTAVHPAGEASDRGRAAEVDSILEMIDREQFAEAKRTLDRLEVANPSDQTVPYMRQQLARAENHSTVVKEDAARERGRMGFEMWSNDEELNGQLEENNRGYGHRTGWPAEPLYMVGRRYPGKPVGDPGFFADELWIIERPEAPAAAGGTEDEGPGSGALMAVLPGEKKEVPVPLKHTDVRAAISGYIATVEVNQQFHNPYDQKIEAMYVFPLPQNAAVNEFLMKVGDRTHPRHHPRAQGGRAHLRRGARPGLRRQSLLTQERPNIFTQSVANIEPGKADRHRHHVLQHARLRGRLVRVRLPHGRRPALQPAGLHAGRRRRRPRPGRRHPARRRRSSTCVPTSAAGTTSRSPSTSTPACPSRTSPASTTPSPPRARATAAPPSGSARWTASRTRTSSCATRWPAGASSRRCSSQRDKRRRLLHADALPAGRA